MSRNRASRLDKVMADFYSAGVSNYGVWWLRNRKSVEPLAYKLKSWLEKIKL